MRLVTRSDFDGLVCGALLLEAGIIDRIFRTGLWRSMKTTVWQTYRM